MKKGSKAGLLRSSKIGLLERINRSKSLFVLLCLVSAALSQCSPKMDSSKNELFEKALLLYREAQKNTDYRERNRALNSALPLLYQARKAADCPAIDAAIADVYFELNEYALAILFYERALHRGESFSVVQDNLNAARSHLNLADPPKALSPLFSLKRLDPIFYGAICIAFFALSLTIWINRPLIKAIAFGAVLMSLVIGATLLFFEYFAPVEAIAVKHSLAYRSMNLEQANALNFSIGAGEKVSVLQISEDGRWLKILLNGQVGFVLFDHFRPI